MGFSIDDFRFTEYQPFEPENPAQGENIQMAEPVESDNPSMRARLVQFFSKLFSLPESPIVWLIRPPLLVKAASERTYRDEKEKFIRSATDEQVEFQFLKLEAPGRSLDAVKIHSPKESDKWVLFVPGMHADYRATLAEAKRLAKEEEVNVLLFNYRGIGSSSGEIKVMQDLVDDAGVALDYLIAQPKIAPKNIVLKGHSLGGVVTYQLLSKEERHRDIKVLFDRSFVNFGEAIASCFDRRFPRSPKFVREYVARRVEEHFSELVDLESFKNRYVTYSEEGDPMVDPNIQLKDKAISKEKAVGAFAETQVTAFKEKIDRLYAIAEKRLPAWADAYNELIYLQAILTELEAKGRFSPQMSEIVASFDKLIEAIEALEDPKGIEKFFDKLLSFEDPKQSLIANLNKDRNFVFDLYAREWLHRFSESKRHTAPLVREVHSLALKTLFLPEAPPEA